MFRYFKYCLTFLLLFGSMGIIAQDACYEQKISFKADEALQYKIYYNWKALWMSAGTVDFSVQNEMIEDTPTFHTTAIGKTYKRYEWFYKVYDVYESYIDTTTYKPVRFVRDISEGDYTKKLSYNFDFEKQEANIPYFYRKDVPQTTNSPITVTPCTFDMLSVVYYVRNLDYDLLAVNDTIPVDVLMDGEVYPLYFVYIGKEELKTEMGTFRCLKLKPSLMDGYIFEGGDFMTIWATDDDNRLPLLIESPLRVGYVKAYLDNFENLRYPLESKVD